MTYAHTRVLAVASGGGHWRQLRRLADILDCYDVHYVTTIDGLPEQDDVKTYSIITETSSTNKTTLLSATLQLINILIKTRAQVVISTGAAPGVIAILVGRIFLCKTLWVDSIANADDLSLSGKIAKRVAHKTLSQWQSVANKHGVDYWGQLL